MSLVNYIPFTNNLNMWAPTPTFDFFNVSQEENFFATSTQPAYPKSRYHEHLFYSTTNQFLGLPHHLIPQTMLHPNKPEILSKTPKAMITPAPSNDQETVLNNRLSSKKIRKLHRGRQRRFIRKLNNVVYKLAYSINVMFKAPFVRQYPIYPALPTPQKKRASAHYF